MITIYQQLLNEAQTSPMLLSDLAGLESYISESYTNRSFIELLQNADDAKACSFYVGRFNGYLIVANDGRPFNSADVESLCRSASSSKIRGNTIGYRGIGFKSVVSIADEVHLISGDYQITFSRELTRSIVPDCVKVPLIRIPHPIRREVRDEVIDNINNLCCKGYTTFFIFSGVDIEHICEEYLSFPITSFLFLNSIRNVTINLQRSRTATISVRSVHGYKDVDIDTEEEMIQWRVVSQDDVSIAFRKEEGKVLRLDKEDAAIHAFLPTEDICGLGVIINGDFSTDPSRRHLIYDETTKAIIRKISCLYAGLIKECIFEGKDNSADLIKALLPYYDYRLIHLTKNTFDQEFVCALKQVLGSSFTTTNVAPVWLNPCDYEIISDNNFDRACVSVPGVIPFMKFLGCREDDITGVLSKLGNSSDISVEGLAQISSYCIKRILLNETIDGFIEIPLFISNRRNASLSEIDSLKSNIDESYIDLLYEKGLSMTDLHLCFKKLSLINLCEHFTMQTDNIIKNMTTVPKSTLVSGGDCEKESETHWFNSLPKVTQSSSPKKWRSVEENTLAVLNLNGFRLTDVSAQNLGYDLEGIDPNGDDIYIEVKSLEWQGQKFRMTNNEFAVAQIKKNKYYLALVIQNKETIEIGLVRNPIDSLKLTRQCVQWVWECSEYEFYPIRFKI